MTAPERILPPWEDENVQRVYRMLWWEGVPTPPSDEHWEGWIARHIVADLYAKCEALEEALTIAIAHIERSGGPRDSYTDAAIERVVRDLRAALSAPRERHGNRLAPKKEPGAEAPG